jgi:hypothetical protein
VDFWQRSLHDQEIKAENVYESGARSKWQIEFLDKDIVKVCRVWYNKKCLLIVGPIIDGPDSFLLGRFSFANPEKMRGHHCTSVEAFAVCGTIFDFLCNFWTRESMALAPFPYSGCNDDYIYAFWRTDDCNLRRLSDWRTKE